MDSVKKDDNMFEFGHMALKIFIEDVELTSSLVNSVVNNKRILEKDFAIVNTLITRLEKEKKLNLVKPEKLERIQARRGELKAKKKFPVLPNMAKKKSFPKKEDKNLKEPFAGKSLKSKILLKKESMGSNIKSGLRKSSMEYKIEIKQKKTQLKPKTQKISEQSLKLRKEYSQYKSVIKFLESRFYLLDSKLTEVVRDDKDKIIMWFNKLITPIDNSIPEFNEIVKTDAIEEWFAIYLVYKKAIGNVSFHKMYNTFLGKVNRKKLVHKIYIMTMEAVDQIMRFGRYVDITSAEDNQYLRNVAKWLGLMTIYRNKPILKHKLDIRKRVLECLKTPTINSFVTILTILISMGCDSLLFKPHNPYMQSLLDLCRELNMVTPVTPASKNYIIMTFKKVNMKNKDCYQFNYIEKRSDVLTCLLYTSPSPRDLSTSRMPSSA